MTDDRRAPLTPSLYRVVSRRREASDVTTVTVEPVGGTSMSYSSGQFNMLTAFGVGEAAISISSAGDAPALEHTVRDVGAVTRALSMVKVGEVIGVRGPFGRGWDVQDLTSMDAVVVAGGIGLAPLRGALHELVDSCADRRVRVFALVGARRPDQIIFSPDLDAWSRAGAHISITVDVGDPGWGGHVGLVTSLLDDTPFDPARTAALLCGPEVMMRLTARRLADMGVDPAHIQMSLERNMQCGVSWCGHCQIGPLLLCRDGPVVRYTSDVATLLSQRER